MPKCEVIFARALTARFFWALIECLGAIADEDIHNRKYGHVGQ